MNTEIKPFCGESLSGSDIDQMVALFKQLDSDEIVDYGKLGLRMTEVEDFYFADKIENDVGFIAVCNGKIVGMVSNVDADEYENAMYVSRLVVDNNYRGNGIGRQLIERAVKNNNARGKRTMLNVSARNDAALALYKSIGFVIHSQTMVSTDDQTKRNNT